ncbi:sensor histidine kinase [Bacillus massiliigorillae]|uniref:sensor histidine kinase n=1 Tax=Bacillus massiliigorillae TaxID=1243664 RepID=UPI0003A10C38|nr:sensor histidine kinase [Bacillus massiliigorillae]
MTFHTYIKNRKFMLLLLVVVIFLFNLNVLLDVSIKVAIDSLLYINILTVSICIVFILFVDYRLFKKEKIEMLQQIDPRISKDEASAGRLYEVLDQIQRESTEEIESLRDELREINDYMTHWIHQVKIPITVLEIIAQRVDEIEDEATLSKDIKVEIDRVTVLVEQALYISRAGNYSSDFLIEEINVGKIVKEVVRKNKYLFIYNKINVEMKHLDHVVLTDKKWMKHIIEQIIHNSCKYIAGQKEIVMYIEENEKSIQLHIKDSGIGISESDIDRVFDKGFTGENGRNRTKSTGMGLYISKKIMNKLSHDITIVSEKNKGTDVNLTFYKLSDYFTCIQ